MSKIVDFRAYKRARRATQNTAPDARHHPDREVRARGLVSIGVVTEELMRRLTEE